ncbi:DnaB-like helicase C-terminal domain-containing protein [Collinsella ihumii]|uniref:DnaB-like helicase C-terminal domain-containing protein n=1 Tax=Collinsella ihumii TaxID=1720204 RepID=A0ABT7XDN3_9ACTN|nr:DnaB-like helicase C-terminal domain-containing protein [Collinsella ihumii]MDN0063521.1 DnaB-like helicase C-terminal domain-containing protein [Collinsella ihumii]
MAHGTSVPRSWKELRDVYGGPVRFLNDGYINAEPPVPTNVPELDEHLCGGLRSGLNVLGGEPGGGKSALALFLSMSAALSGANVLFVSLEMSADQCWSRCASCMSLEIAKERDSEEFRFRWGDVWELGQKAKAREDAAKRTGKAEEFVRELMASDPVGIAVDRLASKCPGLAIADDPALHDIGGIEEAARGARELGMSMLVVDYLQYVDVEGATDEYGRVSAVSKRLNRVGVECGVPVLALASLSRTTAARKPGAIPDMHAFKGSGDIESNALSAWIIDRDPDEPGVRRLHVVKNRNGSVTDDEPVRLRFDGAHNSFERV